MMRKNILAFYSVLILSLTACVSQPSSEFSAATQSLGYPIQENERQIAATSYPVLPTLPREPTTIPQSEGEKKLDEFLSTYGWSIHQHVATHTVTLPQTFQHKPGDFPYAIYWAYNNELSKAIGLDITPYLGKEVQASLYLLNESLPESFLPLTTARAVVLTLEDEIIGAWIDQGRHSGFACSLNRQQLTDVVEQKWGEWLIDSGIVDRSNDLEIGLAEMTPEEIISDYYTAASDHDYQRVNAVRSRRWLSSDLFVNMFNNQALFNHQEEASITIWVDNIESAEILSITPVEKGFGMCLPVYEVRVDLQYVDPNWGTVPEGEVMTFVVLNEEIKGLGWRIEEINTAPGVSQRLCAP